MAAADDESVLELRWEWAGKVPAASQPASFLLETGTENMVSAVCAALSKMVSELFHSALGRAAAAALTFLNLRRDRDTSPYITESVNRARLMQQMLTAPSPDLVHGCKQHSDARNNNCTSSHTWTSLLKNPPTVCCSLCHESSLSSAPAVQKQLQDVKYALSENEGYCTILSAATFNTQQARPCQ